jgi:hypothetical protein
MFRQLKEIILYFLWNEIVLFFQYIAKMHAIKNINIENNFFVTKMRLMFFLRITE